MFFLPISIYKKYTYKINQSEKKSGNESCSARSLGCIANDFSQCDFVQNILKKAPAHYQSKEKKKPMMPV